MSISGIGPSGMDPMGAAESSQSINLSGILKDAHTALSSLSSLIDNSTQNVSDVKHATASLLGSCVILNSIFAETGEGGSDVDAFQSALGNLMNDQSSSNCAALASSLSNLLDKASSTEIKITPQESSQVIQRVIGMASDAVEAAARQSGSKSNPDEHGVIPNMIIGQSCLKGLEGFCNIINLGPDISSSLSSEAGDFATYMEPGQDTQANISHFSSLFNEWATSFFNDVKNQLG